MLKMTEMQGSNSVLIDILKRSQRDISDIGTEKKGQMRAQ